MKKLVVGCALLVVLLVIVGSGAAYFLLYRPAKALISSGAELVTTLNQVNELDATVTNATAFTPPADGALTEAQVTRFVAAMEGLHARMGARATELDAKYKALGKDGSDNPSLSAVVGAYRDLFGLVLDAKRAQVEALNAQRFSVAEYDWVKTRFYEAAGVELTGLDFRELAESARNGNFEPLAQIARDAGVTVSEAVPGGRAGASGTGAGSDRSDGSIRPTGDTPGVGIPDVNKALVAPHKEQMKRWFAYAMFGL